MTRKMLKQEKELREHLFIENNDYCRNARIEDVSELITALVAAVREDCAKVADKEAEVAPEPFNVVPKAIAAAIRGGKK